MHRSPRAITSATTGVSGASDILSSLHVRVGDSWRQDCLTCAQHHSSFLITEKKRILHCARNGKDVCYLWIGFFEVVTALEVDRNDGKCFCTRRHPAAGGTRDVNSVYVQSNAVKRL